MQQSSYSTEAAVVVPTNVDTSYHYRKQCADDNMDVTAFEVAVSIDYNKLIEQFGSKEVTSYLVHTMTRIYTTIN